MTDSNLEDYNQLVSAIYSGPYEDKPWQGFLQQMRKMCSANMYNGLIATSVRALSVRYMRTSLAVSPAWFETLPSLDTEQ